MWISKMEITNSEHLYKNIIIGDSRAIAAFKPEILGNTYYNLALGGGSPIEGYYILKKVLKQQNKIDTLIVSFAPFHLEKADSFWERSLKFGFLNFKEIDEIFYEFNDSNEVFWEFNDSTYYPNDIYSYLFHAYLNRIKFPTKVRPELAKSLFLRGAINEKVYEEIKVNRGYYNFGREEKSSQLNSEAKRNKFRSKSIMIESLEKLFTLAKENDIAVVFQATPMNKASYDALNPDYVKDYNILMADLSFKHDEVDFYGAVFFYEDIFFGDPSHLNIRGTNKFSEEIKNKLRH